MRAGPRFLTDIRFFGCLALQSWPCGRRGALAFRTCRDAGYAAGALILVAAVVTPVFFTHQRVLLFFFDRLHPARCSGL